MTTTWRNWAGDQACVPAAAHRPTSTEQVADVVGAAHAAGRRVKPVGSGHSFTSCALTDGEQVRLDALDQVLHVDRETCRVRVQAGIEIHALNDALASHGLALPNMGDVDRQTVSGAVATATHGTGARLQNVSAQVTAAQVVIGNGSVLEVDEGDELLAARVSLGALGVLTEVELQCVPEFVLHRVDESRPLDDVLDGFDAWADGHDHVELFVFPHADTALTITRDRTDAAAAAARPGGRVPRGAGAAEPRRRRAHAADPREAVAHPPLQPSWRRGC